LALLAMVNQLRGNMMNERVCGPCTICCLHYAVPEIAKPAGEWCRHCTDAGCGIHATRPQPCRNFECFWLMDESFPEDLRPDLSGIVASFNGEDHESVVLHLDPERPDVLAEAPGSELLQALLTAFDPVFIVCGEDRTMVRRKVE
jgi:hypothetical protein